MDHDKESQTGFGCEHCWPPAADAAWEARRGLAHQADLVDESHFHVMLLAFRNCAQQFISVFTETVDWIDGDDPQYWTLMPVTASEAANLAGQASLMTESQLNALGPERQSLRRDHPKAAAPRTFWSTGISIPS